MTPTDSRPYRAPDRKGRPLLTSVFLPELFGTAVLTLLGCGVVANVLLAKTGGFRWRTLMINFGWGLAVFAGVYVAYKSGRTSTPVTIGLLASGNDLGGDTAVKAVVYIVAQLLGAFIGRSCAGPAYRNHYDEPDTPPPPTSSHLQHRPRHPLLRLERRHRGHRDLRPRFVIIAFGKTPSGLGPLAVALLVVGIGASLGGPTGYAINPARDLGPRLAHALLPSRARVQRLVVRLGADRRPDRRRRPRRPSAHRHAVRLTAPPTNTAQPTHRREDRSP